MPVVTRFAPSPTGHLHLGHALAALLASDLARHAGGRFLLRIEDLDPGRCHPDFEAAIFEDLAWLGVRWEEPVRRQSEHFAFYRAQLATLVARGLTYPCFCTRREIAAEIATMPSAPQGPDGPLYPGTCRQLSADTASARVAAGEPHAIRLHVAKCVAVTAAKALQFEESGCGPGGESGLIAVEAGLSGDIVLGRKDVGVSYHLAVVLDDHAQGVTLVSRGNDLVRATHVQRLLQAVLGLDTPRYHHHRLVSDESGRRLSKRDQDLTLAALRDSGVSAAAIRQRLGLV